MTAMQRDQERAHSELQLSQTVAEQLADEAQGIEQEVTATAERVAEQERSPARSHRACSRIFRASWTTSSHATAHSKKNSRRRAPPRPSRHRRQGADAARRADASADTRGGGPDGAARRTSQVHRRLSVKNC